MLNVDIEVTNIISHYESLYKKSKTPDERLLQLKLKQQKLSKEFSYYSSCFTDALRSGKWKQIPSNTLAKNDIIRLLKGDLAPALIERINFYKDGKLLY